MWCRIEPLDVLFFRDSRPFAAGETGRAEGSFPPTPAPLAGALRSLAMACLGVDFVDYANKARKGQWGDSVFGIAGTPDDLGPFVITGPFLSAPGDEGGEERLLLPVPRDLLCGEYGEAVFLQPVREPGWPIRASAPSSRETIGSHSALLLSLAPHLLRGRAKAVESGHLAGSVLTAYLTGETRKTAGWLEAPAGEPEPRVGLEISEGNTAEKGMIYTVSFTRPVRENMAFWVHVVYNAGGEQPHPFTSSNGHPLSFLKLGGESRTAHIQADSMPPAPLDELTAQKKVLVQALENEMRFKLYLMTPALFAGGWIPDGVSTADFSFFPVRGVAARMVAAAVGKPLDIGGWDLARGGPRPMFRAVPPGSVYFFQCEQPLGKEQAKALVDRFHFQSAMAGDSPTHPIFARLLKPSGFGLCAVGIWKHWEEQT